MPTRDADRLLRAHRVIVGLAAICIGLAAVLAHVARQRSTPISPAAALQDPSIRQQVIRQLVANNRGIADSHADPDVGRVGIADLVRGKAGGIRFSFNRFGMREDDYVLPKPDDVVRIVLLGDSMVYGHQVAAEDRLGVHLQRWLEQRTAGFDGRIECLHVGIPSWNIQAETAYLRRQLSDLDPDLVIQVVVPNDMADSPGVRGFGRPSSFSSQWRRRADSLIAAGHPIKALGFSRYGYLRSAIDYESQARYAAAAAELRRLAQTIRRIGSKYRLLVHYSNFLTVARKHLTPHLDPATVVYLSHRFSADSAYTLAPGDPHWNPQGHAKVAQLIYGLITRDDLLPRLAPPRWPQASALLQQVADAGRGEAELAGRGGTALPIGRSLPIAASIDFTRLDARAAAQVHGGLDAEGRVSPYASFVLRNDGRRSLRIDGRTLPRPELDGAGVRVFVDAEPVGDFEIRAGAELKLSYPLPAAAATRPYLSVRFAADDYVYQGADLQHCVVFALRRIALEP